jgi:adenylate cyclase
VRRSGHTVRITAQLINAVTGFHLWSKTYDRDLGDVLKLQTEIATAVAGALKVTLLGDESAKIELGGTRNPAAFDACLHATRASEEGGSAGYLRAVAAYYSRAIRMDPNYPLAFAGRSFVQSRDEFDRARALAPGPATVLRISGLYSILTGHTAAGLADPRRAVTLDPLNALTHHLLGFGLYLAHRYADASAANAEAISLDPNLLRDPGLTHLKVDPLTDPVRQEPHFQAIERELNFPD